MMMELKQLENEVQPHEIILVADSLTGQDAVNIAKEFKNTIDLSSIILTRIDGDGKGCSIKYESCNRLSDQIFS